MKKYLIVLATASIIVSTSCSEKLEVTPPNKITNEQVEDLLATADEETVVTILGAMADALTTEFRSETSLNGWNQEYNFPYAQSRDVMRDFAGNDIVLSYEAPTGAELVVYNFTGTRTADNANYNEPYWIRGYNLVTAANKVANLVTEDLIATNSNNTLKEYLGRTYLTRAYGYLYLMENYGTDELGVPIYTYYDPYQESVSRSTTSATFDSITTWMNRAIELYEQAGVGYNWNITGELNLGVANFILARAALWKQNWATVITACDKLINSYSLMTEEQYVAQNQPTGGYDCVYYADGRGFTDISANPECILGWDYANSGKKGSANYWLNFMNAGEQARIDDRLYNMIDDNDYRKGNFQTEYFGTFNVPGANSFTDGNVYEIGTYINLKFAANVGVGGSVGSTTLSRLEYIDYCLYRVSEAYLMKAEAQAQQGNESAAKETLNILLAARGKGGASLTCDNYSSMSGMSVLEMVQLQSRIEMWGEHSLEFYNNRRWKVNVDRSGSNVHHSALQIPYSQLVLQIPEQEINTNNLIVQNP